jgi:cytosine/adenosine deaminase-related metal-dependent hydrolase
MLLCNLRIPGKMGDYNLLVEKGKIAVIAPSSQLPFSSPGGIILFLPGAIVFPGLINSHDHLDFNLFPLMGNMIYTNYTAWGWDIHVKNAAGIGAVLKIPQELRTQWGLYKNLLNGFTTVVNHGARLTKGVRLPSGNELITVFQDCHNLHSVGFEKNWRWKLNRLSGDRPVVLHVGEGTDAAASREIDRLIRWNFFEKTLIGVHGVAMDERQAAHFKALVWCPDSNYFLLGRTAAADRLKDRLTLLFGTDSTLTSGWNHWDQIRMARREGVVTDEELLEMMTRSAAAVWGLGDRGKIAEGYVADLVIARPGAGDDFFSLNPPDLLLVLHEGQIRLFDETLLEGLVARGFDPDAFYKITIQGRGKYVEGDLPGLMTEIRSYQADAAFPEGLTAG